MNNPLWKNLQNTDKDYAAIFIDVSSTKVKLCGSEHDLFMGI